MDSDADKFETLLNEINDINLTTYKSSKQTVSLLFWWKVTMCDFVLPVLPSTSNAIDRV